ncbi:MAG: Mfa1 fimbrilin C-terminal domain-containing protein, partial [Muribaculaceae bacterium]|nr:Mfa1 fimbrilin C-terminal domain-containing protein [Muribaculaceae bacterium]
SFFTYGVLKYPVPADITPILGTGKVGAKLSEIFSSATSDAKPQSDLAKVMDDLGVTSDAIEVDFYHNGHMYYAIPIRHFEGDDETPDLKDEENWSEWTTANYKYDNKYTGRFGLVRNNWYDMQINSVTGFGTPGLPTPDPEDPDDPKDNKYYINASINILKWAKRTTGYDL